MATCKDCICYEILCRDTLQDDELKLCEHFKNKADFVEVKHGEWLDNIEKVSSPAGTTKDFAIGYKCSLCGRTEISREPYCNCGAKMRRVDSE